MRTCIGCGKQFEKSELQRIVREPDGTVSFDPRGKKAGRGAYFCSQECFVAAVKGKKIQRALRMSVGLDEIEGIAAAMGAAMLEGERR